MVPPGRLPGARPVLLAALLGVACAAAVACAPAVAPGGGDDGARLPRDPARASGADTLTIALLDHELAPPLDTRGFTELGTRSLAAGPIAFVRDLAPADTVAAPFVRLALLRPGADARDLLDSAAAGAAGAGDDAGRPDVLVTRDPAVIAYARAHAGVTVEPLDWDRVHVALVTDSARTRIAATPSFRASLARDAVHADARAAEPPYPWQQGACRGARIPRARPARRVVYTRGDAIARDLAERLVALDRTVTAAALDRDSLTAALVAGADAVYVVALPVAAPPLATPPAGAAPAVADTAAWCAVLPPRPAGSVIVPLVETRAHAIVRGGTPPLVIGAGLPLRYQPTPSAPY